MTKDATWGFSKKKLPPLSFPSPPGGIWEPSPAPDKKKEPLLDPEITCTLASEPLQSSHSLRWMAVRLRFPSVEENAF